MTAFEGLLARPPPYPGPLGPPCQVPWAAELVPHQGQEVGGVGPVEDGEARLNPDRPPVTAEQAIGDGVERAAPGRRSHLLPGHLFRTLQQLGGGPAAEREEEDPLGRDPRPDQMRQAGGEGCGLAGPCPCDDEKVAAAVVGGLPLLGSELGQVEHAFEHSALGCDNRLRRYGCEVLEFPVGRCP